jgi:hypothetical protein
MTGPKLIIDDLTATPAAVVRAFWDVWSDNMRSAYIARQASQKPPALAEWLCSRCGTWNAAIPTRVNAPCKQCGK